MAGDGADHGSGLFARLSGVFNREVFQPLFQNAPLVPGEVRQTIAEMRRKLDLLDEVIAATEAQAPAGSRTSNGARDAWHSSQIDVAEDDGDELDDIGRNQRSRLRELAMLEAMSRETRPYSLQQLILALQGKGFSDSSGAVVSQLHRLKKLGVINQPGSGMYEITDSGLGHFRKLRQSFGALMGEGR